LKASHQLSKYN